ncbi:hypothetical protein B0T25DRAFT_109569 [Lasiosphaeria hispida]|uniref:Uncharacterized protein n=1 Tax=Lasiosphaeria hispida TaxID=260671 RepID=A0AAJ0MHZ1_9PEZI|nr:hypothetical protein B0T25DRAFT_109569 [Lasiosphaeria hispida]
MSRQKSPTLSVPFPWGRSALLSYGGGFAMAPFVSFVDPWFWILSHQALRRSMGRGMQKRRPNALTFAHLLIDVPFIHFPCQSQYPRGEKRVRRGRTRQNATLQHQIARVLGCRVLCWCRRVTAVCHYRAGPALVIVYHCKHPLRTAQPSPSWCQADTTVKLLIVETLRTALPHGSLACLLDMDLVGPSSSGGMGEKVCRGFLIHLSWYGRLDVDHARR